MDERARRVGRNEALFRQINEEVEAINRGLAELTDNTIHIVCECGDLTCQQRIVVPISEYERIRSEPTWFFVVPGHQISNVETVVEEHEGFVVVEKDAGEAANLAKATDPRS